MKEKNQFLSWNTKKNIVLTVCSFVLVGTMGISLWEQSCSEQAAQEEGKTTEFVGKNMEQTSTATNLYMNYVEVEQGDEVSDKTSNVSVDGEMVTGPDVSKSNLVSSTHKDSVEKKSSKSPSVTYREISDSTTKSGPKKAGKSKNRVVSDVSRTGDAQGNRVVENPEPLNYIEKIFANHGISPVVEEVVRKYQYPVEIGYAFDKNYDGKNEPGDFILNKVFDTKKQDEESVEKESKEDSSEEVEEEDLQENSEEIDEDILKNTVSGDAVVEQDEASGDALSKEQEKLEEYRKDIFKHIMPTKPVDVEIEKKVMKTTPVKKSESKNSSAEEIETETAQEPKVKDETSESDETEGTLEMTASGDATEAVEADTTTVLDSETQVIVQTESAAGYYIIKGKMREGSTVYVSDIEILPAGVDGFDKVRMGEEGEFKNSIVLTDDVVNREIQLYFTDGETVTEATTFTYSKDTVTPELQWVEDRYTLLESAERKIYCTKEDKLPIKVSDGEGDVDETLERIQYLYGINLQSVEVDSDVARVASENEQDVFALTMKEDFFGRLLISCRDKAGNVSDIQSQFVLVDHNVPVIQLAQDERCSAPYSLWVNVEEVGHIVSGIEIIQCVVDGNIYEVSESVVRETYTLDEGLEVSSKLTFPIELTEVGTHAVSILVRDYAGNETVVEQTIEVTEPELVSIYMPKNFTIHIDPQQLAGKEQIYSDNVELKNVSKFDVRVNIDKVMLNVKDEVSPEGILKDCDIYLIAPDTGEKIKLSKGDNEDVYSYRLPMDAVGDLANLRFVGTTTKGSERLWKGSDISLSLQVSFVKWEESEE